MGKGGSRAVLVGLCGVSMRGRLTHFLVLFSFCLIAGYNTFFRVRDA